MLGYLSEDIVCSSKLTVFLELQRKTVSFEEQKMSKDKHHSIFSHQVEAFVFSILQISFATRTVLKSGEYSQLVYTKTVDSVKRALIGSSNSEYPALFTSEELGEKMASQFASVTSEEIIQINFL